MTGNFYTNTFFIKKKNDHNNNNNHNNTIKKFSWSDKSFYTMYL